MKRKILFIVMLGILAAISSSLFASWDLKNSAEPKISYILLSSEELAPVNKVLRRSIYVIYGIGKYIADTTETGWRSWPQASFL